MPWLLLILILPYIFFLLRIFSGFSKIKPFKPSGTPELFVSVVIACRNEEKNLPGVLDDLSVQKYNRDNFEVLIVDDNSSDNTIDYASSFRGIKNLKVIRNNGSGKKEAIKTGVDRSLANLIITTDADCRLPEKWLLVIASFFDEYKPDIAICRVIPDCGHGLLSRFIELEFLSLQGITSGTAANGNPVMCNGANLAFKKNFYTLNSGNMHPELETGDDIFLLHSVKKDPECTILWLESDEAAVTTRLPESSLLFLRQRSRWISKAGAYGDTYTIALAIVTFITILLQLMLIAAGFLDPVYWLVYLASYFIKSIPDYLILRNTATRYKNKNLLRWFIPSEVIYPFYVFAAALFSVFRRKKW